MMRDGGQQRKGRGQGRCGRSGCELGSSGRKGWGGWPGLPKISMSGKVSGGFGEGVH